MPTMGSTKENSLADLVHANAVGRNTCRITVATAKGKGTFHMEDGEIVDASYGDLVGEPAFYALVNAADPGFSANSGMKAPARRINTGLQTLMLNAMTLRFEGRVPEPTFPPSREVSPFEPEPHFGPSVLSSRAQADLVDRTVPLQVPAIPVRIESPRPTAQPAPPGPLAATRAAVVGPPAGQALPHPAAGKVPEPVIRTAGATAAPTKQRAGRSVIAAGLVLVVAAAAYFVLSRTSAQAGPGLAPGGAPPPAAAPPVEPVESATLTGPGDVQPELLSGSAPRSPDPESAVLPTVVCRLLIGEDGTVKEASVFRSRLDLAKFEEAAIVAVKAYRFRPALRAGRTVSTWTNFPVAFQ